MKLYQTLPKHLVLKKENGVLTFRMCYFPNGEWFTPHENES